MNTLSQVISILKDVAIGAASLTAAIVAIRGLKTWKLQLVGHEEYELAKRVITSAYKLRDSIQELSRRKWIQNPKVEAEFNLFETEEEIRLLLIHKMQHDLAAQIAKVKEDKAEFGNLELEVETLWGWPLRDKCKGLLQMADLALELSDLVAFALSMGEIFAERREKGLNRDAEIAAAEENAEQKIAKLLPDKTRELEVLILPHLRKNG